MPYCSLVGLTVPSQPSETILLRLLGDNPGLPAKKRYSADPSPGGGC